MGSKWDRTTEEEMVRRLSGPDAMTPRALSREVRISPSVLSRWVEAARRLGVVTRHPDGKRTAQEKARLVLEANRLVGEERGALLRREGLFEADIEAWQKTIEDAFTEQRSRRDNRALAQDKRRILHLEKELKAANALLELKKKVDALWGDAAGATKPKRGK